MLVSINLVYNLLQLPVLLSSTHCYTFAISKQHNQMRKHSEHLQRLHTLWKGRLFRPYLPCTCPRLGRDARAIVLYPPWKYGDRLWSFWWKTCWRLDSNPLSFKTSRRLVTLNRPQHTTEREEGQLWNLLSLKTGIAGKATARFCYQMKAWKSCVISKIQMIVSTFFGWKGIKMQQGP